MIDSVNAQTAHIGKKIALVHDWAIHMRGGEKVLDAMAEAFPQATLYVLFCDKSKLSPRLQNLKIKTSFLQWLPGIKKYYRWLLPLFPLAVSSLRIDSDTEWVVSSSHCVAKGVPIPRGALHVCYCNTPMRYAWVAEDVYFRGHSSIMRWMIHQILNALKRWDLSVNRSVDLFIGNSMNIRERIRKIYGRDGEYLYPQYEDDFFKPTQPKGEYYFTISAFVPYKKIDIVIEAFNDLNRELVVAGSGPMEKVYKSLTTQPRIRFVGGVSDEQLRDLYSGAKAVLFPAEEDFGIVPLEAQACGTPVIAYGKGGSLETVKSGVFFNAQTPEAVKKAVLEFESKSFSVDEVCGKMSGFHRSVFVKTLRSMVFEAAKKKHEKKSPA